MTHIFDKKYYETKYNLSFQNNDEAENHYNITGKKKGYFPSLQSEIFFCKSVNFDHTFYKQKYNLSCSNSAAKKHWQDIGSKKNYVVNLCEDKKEHIPNCKCKYKNTKHTNTKQNNTKHTNALQTNMLQTNMLQTNALQKQVEQVLNTAKKEYIFREELDDSDCDCSDCMNDNAIPNIPNIPNASNISNLPEIKEYLNVCKTQLNIIQKLLQQCKQNIVAVCDPLSNYIIYNASRVKIQKILKEIHNISLITHNKLPIFHNKKTSSIIYPLFKTGDSKETFKIKLIKISLKQLKLEKYVLPSLNKNCIITHKTNIIPPSECPIGKKPSREMYTDEMYSKYWSASYHMQLMNDAIYYAQIQMELLENNITLLETKYKI